MSTTKLFNPFDEVDATEIPLLPASNSSTQFSKNTDNSRHHRVFFTPQRDTIPIDNHTSGNEEDELIDEEAEYRIQQFNNNKQQQQHHTTSTTQSSLAELDSLYNVTVCGDSEADITAWINKRKSNYPTTQRLQKKQLQLQYAVNVGALTQNETNRIQRNKHRYQKNASNTRYNQRTTRSHKPYNSLPNRIDNNDSNNNNVDHDSNNITHPITDVVDQPVPSGDQFVGMDDTITAIDTISNKQPSNSTMHADRQAMIHDKTVTVNNTAAKNTSTRQCKYYQLNGTCNRGDTCNFVHSENSAQHNNNKPNDFSVHDYISGADNSGAFTGRELLSIPAPVNTQQLLHKLYNKEIIHEHSMVLQCFRYFVRHNFFIPTSGDGT